MITFQPDSPARPYRHGHHSPTMAMPGCRSLSSRVPTTTRSSGNPTQSVQHQVRPARRSERSRSSRASELGDEGKDWNEATEKHGVWQYTLNLKPGQWPHEGNRRRQVLRQACRFRRRFRSRHHRRPLRHCTLDHRPPGPQRVRAAAFVGHARAARGGSHCVPVLPARVPAAVVVPGGEGAARSLHADEVLGRDALVRRRADGAGADGRRAVLRLGAPPPRRRAPAARGHALLRRDDAALRVARPRRACRSRSRSTSGSASTA